MKLRTHLWTSVAAGGGLWFATGSSNALLGAIIGGVLIDADHVIDQLVDRLWGTVNENTGFGGCRYMGRGRNRRAVEQGAALIISLVQEAQSHWFRRRKLIRLPLVFHSYELLAAAIVVAALVRTPMLLGLVTGYALHVALDLIRHHHEFRSRLFYLLLYRLSVGFRRDRLIKREYL